MSPAAVIALAAAIPAAIIVWTFQAAKLAPYVPKPTDRAPVQGPRLEDL